MRRSVVFLCSLVPLLALSPAVAQGPAISGEHVVQRFASQHPYRGPAGDEPQLIWTDRIHHANAIYIAPHFSRMDLAEGDYVIVRSPDGSQSWIYTGFGRHDLGKTEEGFFATHIRGDTAIVELWSRKSNRSWGYEIDKFGRGYSDQELIALWDSGLGPLLNLVPPPGGGGGESICTTNDTENVVCYAASNPAAYQKAQAGVRLLLNGNAHCTGWLFGDEGHVMTNEHCVTSQAQLNSIDFEFGAEGATCGTNCSFTLGCPGTIEASGGTFITDNAPLDYALLLPDTTVGGGTDLVATYGFLQARETGAAAGERIYIIQHPAGWGKHFAMISTYPGDPGGFPTASLGEPNCTGAPATGDVGYWADTQGGSSGSAVLGHSDNLVVALHHCRGSAFCTTGDPGTDTRNRGVPIEAVIADMGAFLPNNAVATDIFSDGFESGDTSAWSASVP